LVSYDNFEAALVKKNATAYMVSKGTGISTATLSSWKNGKYTPKVDKLIKIAAFLEIPLKDLIKEDVETG